VLVTKGLHTIRRYCGGMVAFAMCDFAGFKMGNNAFFLLFARNLGRNNE
jgi:hypothetical protein